MPEPLPMNYVRPAFGAALKHHAIPLSAWSAAHPGFARLAVGALIFQQAAPVPRVLLLRRANHDSFPGIWEMPGGSVDPEDASIIDGLAREVWEETRLSVSHVETQVFQGESGSNEEVTFWGRSRKEQWTKLCFVLKVTLPEEVKLDPEEHQDWGWFTKEEARGKELVNEQARQIVMNAFDAVA